MAKTMIFQVGKVTRKVSGFVPSVLARRCVAGFLSLLAQRLFWMLLLLLLLLWLC
jgi:hypothetical protein